MSCMYAHDADPALLFSSLNKMDPIFPDSACAKKIDKVRPNHEMCLGRKVAFSFRCLHPRHWFPCTTLVHSLSRPPGACTVLGVKVSNIPVNYRETMHTEITLHRPRPVTEVWSALRSFNLMVPVFYPHHWERSDEAHTSIRHLLTAFSHAFSLHVAGPNRI